MEAVSPALLLGVGVGRVKTCPEVRCVDADFSLRRDGEAHSSVRGRGLGGHCETRRLPEAGRQLWLLKHRLSSMQRLQCLAGGRSLGVYVRVTGSLCSLGRSVGTE